MDNVAERLLNPTVLITMLGAGVAYAWLLWSLRLRPNLTLWATAITPGAMFLIVIWVIRAAQGVAALTYIALLADWMVFSVTGVVVVLIARRWCRHRSRSQP